MSLDQYKIGNKEHIRVYGMVDLVLEVGRHGGFCKLRMKDGEESTGQPSCIPIGIFDQTVENATFLFRSVDGGTYRIPFSEVDRLVWASRPLLKETP